MTAVLGVSAFYHDSAAALIVDGTVVAAAQEERFTRRKHDAGFPALAARYCLETSGIAAADLDYVAYYEKPLRKFERLIETYLGYAPLGVRSFAKAMPAWLREKLHIPRQIRAGLGAAPKRRIVFVAHHESHAASGFFPSPFERAAILTMDGVGEWATATIGAGEGGRVRLLRELHFPHSLGLLYTAFTYYCGFKPNSGEYKLMGLAPYGEPRHADAILEHLIDLRPDGSFRLDLAYFNYCAGLTMTSPKFHRLFGGPPRAPESALTQREMDLAASIQAVTEQVVMRAAAHAHALTGASDLCLAGGVALNCVANGRLLREGPFERIWVQPAAGDAGGALGAASFVWHQLLENERRPVPADGQQGSRLGPEYTPEAIREVLTREGAVFEECDDEQTLCDRVAELLDGRQVVGWFQGRMEFGPRALGSRSILGDPRNADMQRLMNQKIKYRESFRPFAPSVLADRAHEYFDVPAGVESPYMAIVAPVAAGRRQTLSDADRARQGLAALDAVRSEIPAVTHVDCSARLQTVGPHRDPLYHRLLQAFDRRTGCPVLINTSFNVRGEPIVCTPADAWRCFLGTEMDVLAIGPFLVLKSAQPQRAAAVAAHAGGFAPD